MTLPSRPGTQVVIIGSSKYDDPSLTTLGPVKRSLEDLFATLADPEIGIVEKRNCRLLLNQTSIPELGRALNAAALAAEDLLLVYFAGHGLVGGRRGELFLATPNSNWSNPEWESVKYEMLRDSVLDSPARTKAIILDCCFSGRAFGDTMSSATDAALGQVDVDGTYVMASAPWDKASLILPGEEHTAFTGRLINVLRYGLDNEKKEISLTDAFVEVRRQMRSAGLPEPQRRGTGSADQLGIAINVRARRPPSETLEVESHQGSLSVDHNRPQRPRVRARRRMKIRRALSVALLLTVVVSAGWATRSQVAFASVENGSRSAYRLVNPALIVAQKLQTERDVIGIIKGGDISFLDEMGLARQAVDVAIRSLTSLTKQTNSPPALSLAIQNLHELPKIRGQQEPVDRLWSSQDQFKYSKWYTDRSQDLARAADSLASNTSPGFEAEKSRWSTIEDLEEATSEERGNMVRVFAEGAFWEGADLGNQPDYVTYSLSVAERSSAYNRLLEIGTPEEVASAKFIFGNAAARELHYFEEIATSSYDGRHVAVDPQAAWSSSVEIVSNLIQLADHSLSIMRAIIDKDSNALTSRLALIGIGSLMGGALILYFGWRKPTDLRLTN